MRTEFSIADGISTAYAYYKSLFDKEHPNIKALTSWLTRVFQ